MLTFHQHRDILTYRIRIDRNHDPATGAFLEPAATDVVAVTNDIGHTISYLITTFSAATISISLSKQDKQTKGLKRSLNRRIPNCNTVLQTVKDLFQREIRPNSPENYHFSTFFVFQNSQILLGIVQLGMIVSIGVDLADLGFPTGPPLPTLVHPEYKHELQLTNINTN